MTGQKAQSKSELLLQMLASFLPNCRDICPRRICRGQSGLQEPNGSEPNCIKIAVAARELSELLDDEIIIFEDNDRGGYDYCTGRAYHHGWGQTLLEKEVIFSSVKGWY